MSESEKSYTNGEITVVWKAGFCTHSARCLESLSEVFDVNARPGINMHGSGTDRIVTQVDPCPSGALSYLRNKNTGKAAD